MKYCNIPQYSNYHIKLPTDVAFHFRDSLFKVCLVSVKQGNFIYMPVLRTICVAVCAQESIPANTKHCNEVFGMSKTFYGCSKDTLATSCVGRDVNIFHMIACCII